MKKIEPTQLVIFGASGNLTSLKIMPALYHLSRKGLLPENYIIWGVARREWSDNEFSNHLKDEFKKTHNPKHPDEKINDFVWKSLSNHIKFIGGEFQNPKVFSKLNEVLRKQDDEWGICSEKVFYFSVASDLYSSILEGLEASSLKDLCNKEEIRLVIEKPFGKNHESALALNKKLGDHFKESQIYRIDHVLGKDTLVDILSFRSSNQFINELLAPKNIDRIQISYLESIGVGTRGGFYEQTGVVRDMVQNHVVQILAAVLAELPKETGESMNEKRAEILKNLVSPRSENIIAGQYESYTKEEDVDDKSNVPTFLAFKTKWKEIPVFIRTGKMLKGKYTEVSIILKNDNQPEGLIPNMVTFRLQPQEGVFFVLNKRTFENNPDMENVTLEFCYKRTEDHIKDAYENLLYSVLIRDRKHFVGIDEVLAGWKLVDPINEMIEEESTVEVTKYEDGSWGPKESAKLLENNNTRWYTNEFKDVCKL